MTDTPNPTLHTPKPSNAFAPLRAYANAEMTARSGAGNIYPKIDTLHKGKSITLWEPKEVANDGSIWIYFEYIKDGLPTGAWINSASLNITFHPPTVEVKTVSNVDTKPLPEQPATPPALETPPILTTTPDNGQVKPETPQNGSVVRKTAILKELKVIAVAINALITLLEDEPEKEATYVNP